MADSLIKVGSGAPELDLEFGTYEMTLTGLSQKTITVEGEDKEVFEWVFAIPVADGGDPIEVNGLTSIMTGPKSKTAAFIAALFGKPAEPGTELNAEDLIGKSALGTVGPNKNGYPKVTDLVAKPKATAAAGRPRPTPTIAETVESPSADTELDDLPF